MKRYNAARLRLAREKVGLSKTQLAEQVGLTPRRIGDFESRSVTPPSPTLTRLAVALGYPVEFFEKGEVPAPENLSFRSQSRMRAATRKSAVATSSLAAEFNSWLEQEFTFDKVTLPADLAGVDPEIAANVFRGRMALGIAPAPNLIHLSELVGVRVLGISHTSPHLDAFSFWCERRPFILLNKAGTAERRRWNLAHELGHLILHRGAHHLPSDRGREDEADRFAAEFLLPAEGLRRSGADAATLDEVDSQKISWAVSATAYIRRMRDLGFLSEWVYRSLVIDASEAGLRREEDVIQREVSPALTSAMRSLLADGISTAAIARDLRFRSVDVQELLHGLTLTAISGSTNEPESGTGPRRQADLRLVHGGKR